MLESSLLVKSGPNGRYRATMELVELRRVRQQVTDLLAATGPEAARLLRLYETSVPQSVRYTVR